MADTVARTQLSAFSVRGRLLVAAGFGGELVVKDLARGRLLHYGLLTHDENAITNCVQLVDGVTSSAVGDRLLTASNDCVVRVFDTERLAAPASSIKLDWSVNAVAQQPRGGHLLAAVGDHVAAALVDARSGEAVATLAGHSDFSFAVSWHPDGNLFATGSQDHTCRVWDARMVSCRRGSPAAPPVAAAAGAGAGAGAAAAAGGRDAAAAAGGSPVVAVLYAHLGAVRSVTFAPCGRYLGIAEPRDFVHVYDVAGGGGGGAPFSRCQEIDLFGEVGGLAFSPDSAALYVGVHDRTYGSLMEFHRSDYRRESRALL